MCLRLFIQPKYSLIIVTVYWFLRHFISEMREREGGEVLHTHLY